VEFKINNTAFYLQIIPTYGLAIGLLYYNPNLEPSKTRVDEYDFYEQITFLFVIFGLHLTWWKYE